MIARRGLHGFNDEMSGMCTLESEARGARPMEIC
jgi:hypothetical protein